MNLMHKNHLQEFTQKSAIPLPVYHTVNVGSQNAPQFRSTVVVDGKTFTSPDTFPQRKAAEQDVARLALEAISNKIKFEGVPLIQAILEHEGDPKITDATFCKSILYEYALKMNLEKPAYTTSQAEGLLPMFISHSLFNGQTYMGSPAKNKREAEQKAARAVIESILANSDSRTLMCKIIKSKGKLFAAMNKGSCTGIEKGKEVEGTVTTDRIPDSTYSQDEQLAKTAAAQPFLSVAEKPKGEHPCEVNPGTVGSGYPQTTSPDAGLQAKGTTKELNSVDMSHLAQNNQVNNGVKLIGPSGEAGDAPGMALSNSGKRHANEQRENGNELKKARTDEQLPSMVPAAIPCESSVVPAVISCESSAVPAVISCESSAVQAAIPWGSSPQNG